MPAICLTNIRFTGFLARLILFGVIFGGFSGRVILWAEQPPLIFGGNANYPPITYVENGTPQGVIVDIVSALEKSMRRPIDVRLMEWKDVQTQVLDNTIDFMGPMAITEARQKLFDFSDAVLKLKVSICVRKDTIGIASLADLRGRKVGVAAGGLAHQTALTEPQINLVLLGDDQVHNFQLLANGELDAILIDFWNGSYLLAVNHIATVMMLDTPVLRKPSSFAVKKGNTALLEEINQRIRALDADGTLTRIQDKWHPQETIIQTRAERLRDFYVIIIGSLFVLLAAGAIWIVALNREITRRKHAEEAVKKSTAQLRTLLKTIPDPVWLKDSDGVYLACNLRMEKLYGAPETDIVGKTDYDFVDRTLADSFRQNDLTAIAVGKPTMNEEHITYAEDGHREYLETVKTPIYDNNGQLIGVLGIGRDITERKRTEDALRQSQQLLTMTFASLHDAIFIVDAEKSEIVDCNPRASEIFGYAREEMLGRTTAFLHVDNVALDEFRGHLRRAVEAQGSLNSFEFKMKRKDGTIFPTEHNVLPLGQSLGWVSVVSDITERKKAEDALRLSEEKFAKAFNISPDAITLTDIETGEIIDANAGFERFYGYAVKDVIGKTAFELGVWADVSSRTELIKILKRDGMVMDFETNGRRKSGELIYALISGSIISVGERKMLVLTVRDITERKRAETALAESEHRYRMLFENASLGIFHSLPEGRFLRVNPALAAMLGYSSPEELVAQITDIGTQLYVDSNQRAEILTTTLQRNDWQYAENRYRRTDGSIMTANLAVRKVLHPDGTFAYLEGFLEDITERKRAEAELQNYREHLEELVRERTDELETKTQELEMFNQAMVNRELRIIELKEELNRLCAEFGREPEYPPIWKET